MRYQCLILILLCFFTIESKATEPKVFDEATCEDYQKIAREFIDVELAGARWQGTLGPTQCLTAQHLQTVKLDRASASDPRLLDPEFLIPENRKVEFSVKRLPNDLLEVVMNYLGKKNQKDIAVKDRFTLKLNYGKVRESKGCASWYVPPEHFVMRSKCWTE